jgi:hypothetical protein
MIDFRFAARTMMDIAVSLRGYDSQELRGHVPMLMAIADELKKLAPPLSDFAGLTVADLKPEPPKSDPNSKIPRPTTPPRGGAPVRLATPIS